MTDRTDALIAAARESILVLDGAMGTVIQGHTVIHHKTYCTHGPRDF